MCGLPSIGLWKRSKKCPSEMAEPNTENREGTPYVPRWLYFPVAKEVFLLAFLILLVPGGWSIYLLLRGQVLAGVLVLALWAALFGWLAVLKQLKEDLDGKYT